MGAHWIRFPRFFGDAMMIHTAIAPLRAAGLPLVAWGPGWVVDLFAGSAEYCAAVPDPERKYSPLQAAALLRGHRPASLINFPKSHRPMLAAFLARVPGALDCAGQGGLAVSAAWIAGARALVGMDSGLAHLAAGCGIPTLAVFGPTRPRHSAPRGPRVRVVRREDLGCLECMTFECPVPGLPCMTALPDDFLWKELQAVMETALS
jgi:ADP-heptose:LPS heptosyltransferase